MSHAVLFRLLKLAKAACVVFVALGAIFCATAFAEVTDSSYRSAISSFPVSQAVEHVAARNTIPCSDNAHGVGQCCSVLHCLVGIAAAPSVLAIVPMESVVDAKTVASGASLIPARLDRPPKS